jgi:restriction system protein
VAKRRGFFAELNHQAQLAERRRQQQARAAYRAQVAAQREAEAAHRALERAQEAAARASAAEQKTAEREAVRLYAEQRQAEVAAKNAELRTIYADIDGLLAATLNVDDWVDLEEMRITHVDHPAFDPGALARAIPPPPPPQYAPQPVWHEPEAPRGLSGLLGGRKHHEEHVARARAQFEEHYRYWHHQATAMHGAYQAQVAHHQAEEQKRMAALDEARARYDAACRQREQEAADRNAQLDRLINELAFDVPWAIQEYIDIVLSNSTYPDGFPVTYDHRFDLETRELTLAVRVPEPSQMPAVREYKYLKAKDEIAETALPVKEKKDRYASAVAQVALRILHEVFEADRSGRIHSIALTVDTQTIDPATGQPSVIPLVVVAADRATFTSFELANVTPSATLAHLGAAISKSPFDLKPADTSRGVRTRAR